MDPSTLDPHLYARGRIRAADHAAAWRGGDAAAMRSWQRRARRRLARQIGLPPAPTPASAPVVAERRSLDGYDRAALEFDTRPGMRAFAYLLEPRGDARERPGVLCLPGHGRGVDSIVGIGEDGGQRALGSPGEYQADFALQCAAHGYVVLALEQVSFGRRRDARAAATGPEASSCARDAAAALMLGETITGWRVWDAMRALDVLAGTRGVDRRRLAVMGISGGGLTSFWTACLDTRVRAAVISGYFNTFADSVLAVDHCPDNYVPGMLGVMEMPDMAGLVAPRALFVESGRLDPIFPLEGFVAAVDRARSIYAAHARPEAFGWAMFEGDHRFDGEAAFAFLDARMRPPARPTDL
ncbi:MAG: acetylxylan esterase [Chthonomonadales bacterium]|nr:acetylxylan esterase [Chthonomonadales bacterium]